MSGMRTSIRLALALAWIAVAVVAKAQDTVHLPKNSEAITTPPTGIFGAPWTLPPFHIPMRPEGRIHSSSMAQSFTCPTSDDVAVQGQLDVAAAAGGGTVQLEPRVYQICEPLILGSNVHLRGAGRGATVIQGSQYAAGKTVDGSYINAVVSAVATNNSSVSDLTIDLATNARNTNGITFIPATVTNQYDGTASTNGLVERVEVRGTPGMHAYMIWNLRGQHMKFVNNWIDGGEPVTLPADDGQMGIESYGGYDVVIENNTVANIGETCINVGTAGDVLTTETVGIIVADNYVSNCTTGISVDAYKTIPNMYTHIRSNVISNSRLFGITSSVGSDSPERDLEISNNSIVNTGGGSGWYPAGISLASSGPDAAVPRDYISGVRVESNDISTVFGGNGHGIRVIGYPNAKLIGNSIADTEAEGIFVVNSTDAEIRGNRIDRPGYNAISVQSAGGDISNVIIDRNVITDWPVGTFGVFINQGRFGIVSNNILKRTDSEQPYPVWVYGSCGVTATGDQAWYGIQWQEPQMVPCQ